MKYSSHLKELYEKVGIALKSNKRDLISTYKSLLNRAHTLFQNDQFEFWLKQIGTTPVDEIPITKYGLEDAQRSFDSVAGLKRSGIENLILSTSGCLFTYSNEDELCCAQSEYRYYVSIEEGKLFKLSDLGFLEPNDIDLNKEYRIAYKSEVNADESEFIC